MKYPLFIVKIILLVVISSNASSSTLILIPPFENFSDHKKEIEYETIVRDDNDITKIKKISYPVEQLSEIARSIMEDRVLKLGANLIERTRVDQLINEQKLTQNNKFINEQSALSMGKLIGANTLLMGSILGFNVNQERIKAYGINQSIKTVICSIRVRIIDIKSGKLLFSSIVKGENKLPSSNFVSRSIENQLRPALSDALDNFLFGKEAKELLLN